MRLVAGRIMGGKKRAPGVTTIEVVGPASTLAQKIARVLEQHGRTGAALGETILMPKRSGARGSRLRGGSRSGPDSPDSETVSIDVPPAPSRRAFVVNALK